MAHAGTGRADFKHIVVPRRPLVSNRQLRDGKEYALLLELAIVQPATPCAQKFGTAHLQPGGIRAVMGDTHGIAFDVAHTNGDGVLAQHRERTIARDFTPGLTQGRPGSAATDRKYGALERTATSCAI